MAWRYVMGFVLALALACATNAQAQTFPTKPITLIITFAPGGITDVTARHFADVVSKSVGQPVIIDNRPTGGGAVAAVNVQQAAPDGYTLLVFAGAQHAALAALQSVSYDPVNDFEPVTVLFNLVNFLAVPKDSPANSVAELLEIGRKKPGGLTFGSTGVGSPAHLQAAILSRSTKTPMEYVQYRGSAPLMSDLVTGRVDFSFVSYTGVRSFLSDGKLKILAVINDQRWSDMPNVPTLTEAGVTMDDVGTWFGVIAPKGTPPAVVQRLNAEFVTASKDPELRRKLLELGVVITTTSPAQMRTLMVDQVKRTRELVEALGLRSQ